MSIEATHCVALEWIEECKLTITNNGIFEQETIMNCLYN